MKKDKLDTFAKIVTALDLTDREIVFEVKKIANIKNNNA